MGEPPLQPDRGQFEQVRRYEKPGFAGPVRRCHLGPDLAQPGRAGLHLITSGQLGIPVGTLALDKCLVSHSGQFLKRIVRGQFVAQHTNSVRRWLGA